MSRGPKLSPSKEASASPVKRNGAPSTSQKVAPKVRKLAMGKPKLLALSSFILLGVEAMMKLDGITIRNIWASQGRESTYLRAQRLIEQRVEQLPNTLKSSLVEAFSELPESVLKSTLLQALDGDQDAMNAINAMGEWEVFQKSVSSSGYTGISSWVDQLVELEKASKAVDLHLSKGDFARAAALATESSALRPYLTSVALEKLGNAKNAKDALFARVAGLCEVLLSQIARVERLNTNWPKPEDGFAHLIQFKEGELCEPGKLLFLWIKKVLGAKTLAELRVQATRNGIPVIDESTLKRWNSGREFPRGEKFEQFITALEAHRKSIAGEAVPTDRIYGQYRAARRLQKLLDLANLPWGEELRIQKAVRPWSEMMGYESAHMWIQARYPFWQDYWDQTLRDEILEDKNWGEQSKVLPTPL